MFRAMKGLRAPVPTKETLPYIAAELGATSYEESDEEADLLPAASTSRRRVQRKLVTGTEEIDGNQEYQEYQGVMGRPGVDFPILPSIPITSFSCRNVKSSGYYADLETNCQVFHICDGGRKISFLCPNGTIFRQSHLICDWWFRVDCDRSVELYEESAEQLAADQRIYKERAEALAKAMQRGSNRTRANGQQQSDQKRSDHASVPQNNFQNRRHNNRKHSNNRYTIPHNDNNNNQFVSEKQESVTSQNLNHNTDHFLTSRRTQQSQRRQPETSEKSDHQSYNVESPEHKNFQQNAASISAGNSFNSNRQSKSQDNQNQEYYESSKLKSNDQYSFEQTSSKNNLQSLEQERQLPAETASFASNRNNNFGNHFIQHNYFKTSTSKDFRQSVPNELSRNTLPITSSTTESQFYSSTTQPAYNSDAYSHQTPLFNTKLKPNKSFSYFELQQTTHPLQSSSTQSPTPYVAFSPQAIHGTSAPMNLNSNNLPTNLGYAQIDSLNTFTSSYPTSPSFNVDSPDNQSDVTVTQNTPVYPSFNNNSSYTSATQTSNKHFATNHQPSFSSVTPEYLYTSTTESPGYYYQNNYFSPNVSLPSSNSDQLPYSDPKLVSFPPPFLGNYVSGVSTTLLPPNYDSYTAFNNEPSSGNETNQITSQYVNTLAEPSQLGNRIGLKVPISSGPKALHSLALYYATSESDVSSGTTSLPPTKTTKVSISEILLTSHSGSPAVTETNILPSADDTSFGLKDVSSILTKATKDSYRYLFNETSDTEDNIQNVDSEVKLKSQDSNDLDIDQSSGIVQQTTTTETTMNMKINETDYFPDDQKLKESTDLRELAQVFSRALSAYLEDPENFRKVLSEVRPTEPSSENMHAQSLAQESEEEVLDYSDTGVSGVSPTTPTICDDGDGTPVINIDEINNLVQSVKQNLTSDNYEVIQTNENKDRLQTDEFFTTGNPTSLADVNYFFSNRSHFISDVNSLNINNSYFPTAGSVNDESRPRYGGFHNNSKSLLLMTSYAPYGIEIPESRTGQPFHETFPTETNTEFEATTEKRHIHPEIITENVFPITQNFIRLESIADTLNAGDALDVNSLASSNNFSPKPATGHYITSSDIFMKSTRAQPTTESSTSLPYEYKTADDQEKVLITSSSQSLASRNNYVRFFTRTQNYGSKYQSYNINVNNGKNVSENSENKNSHTTKNSKTSEPLVHSSDSGNTYGTENIKTQSVNNKAADTESLRKTDHGIVNIHFKTVHHIQPVELSTKTIHELSNIQHHNHNYHSSETAINDPQTVVSNLSPKSQHISYQSVDLGNGVTIERRRTIPQNDTNSWPLSEVLENGTTINSYSLNNLLTSLDGSRSKPSETTEYSVSTQTVHPTTYHPSNANDDFDMAESIPPRGHQLRTWQWDVQKTTPIDNPKKADRQDQNLGYKTTSSEGAESITKPYTDTLNSVIVPATYASNTSPEILPTTYVEQINAETIPTTHVELVNPETFPTVYGELLQSEAFIKLLKPVSISTTHVQSSPDTANKSYRKLLLNSSSMSTLYDTIDPLPAARGEQSKSENVPKVYNTHHVRNSSPTTYAKESHIDFSSVLQSPYAPFAEHLPIASKKHSVPSTTKLENLTSIVNKSETLEAEANEMFGGLNETSTNTLMDMMNQAESNMTIRKLVLLLVADQSGRQNKSVEESRSQLIQALLQKPSNQTPPNRSIEESSLVNPESIKPKKIRKANRNSSIQTTNYTTGLVLKNKSNEHQSRGTKTYRDTDASTEIRTSIQQPSSTHQSSVIRNPKVSTLHTQTSDFSSESDSRAVELLKSLYNLAAKWG